MTLRILLVAPLPPPPGGIGRWTQGLLQFASDDSAVEIVLVCSTPRFRSVWNLALTARIFGGLIHGTGLFARFASRLLSERIDVVHITTSCSLGTFRDIALSVFARFLGRPVVLHIRNGRLPAAVTSQNWETTLIKIVCRLAKSVIVLDAASGEALRSLVPGRSVFVVPNPAWKIADAPATPLLAGDPKVIVFAGWLIPDKGVRELVLACRDILDFEFRLDLIGPVKEGFREELRALACGRGDGKWMNMLGQVEGEEVLARIASGFLLALPSYTEGCPNVILEAMMLGKPVVATPVGAIPDMLSLAGVEPCGICVPVRNVDALRIAIRSLLKQPDYAMELGRRGRERVAREYSPKAVYARYKSIWETASVR